VRPALPVCACCGAPALLGGWVPAGPHVARWACSTCAGADLAHPFVSRSAVPPARARIRTSEPADLAEKNTARTKRVQLVLDLDVDERRPAL